MKRSNNFVPDLISILLRETSFTCKFSDLPSSYQSQPYNLAAKIAQRGGILVKAVFNKEKDHFVLVKTGICNITKKAK